MRLRPGTKRKKKGTHPQFIKHVYNDSRKQKTAFFLEITILNYLNNKSISLNFDKFFKSINHGNRHTR